MTLMKIRWIIAALTAAALVLASCEKQPKYSSNQEEEGGENTEVVDPGENTDPEEPEGPVVPTDDRLLGHITVTAPESAAGCISFQWSATDVISVWSGTPNDFNVGGPVSAEYTADFETPSVTASFKRPDSPEPVAADGLYFAAYPLSGVNQWYNTSGYRLYFSFYKEQVAVKDGWDSRHGAMVATSEYGNFIFRHLSAYVKFTVAASCAPFVSLKVATPDGTNIVDRLRVDLPAMTYSPNNLKALRSDFVTIAPAGGAAFEAGTYYISIVPRTYSEFNLTFTNADGKTVAKQVSVGHELQGGEIVDLGSIDGLNFNEELPTGPDPHLATAYKSEGVYFWIDPFDKTKGKIVSPWRAIHTWGPNGQATGATSTDPAANITALKTVAGEGYGEAYALYACEQLGTGWRLPTRKEWEHLYNTYFGKALDNELVANTTDYRTGDDDAAAAAAKFEAALTACGATEAMTLGGTEKGPQYWTDCEKAESSAYTFRFGIINATTSTATKSQGTPSIYTRCVKEVTVE